MDFRDKLYERYVTTHTRAGDAAHARASASARASREAWLAATYRPILADIPRDARVLDVGCGNGGFLAFLRRQGFTRLHGVDASPEQVEVARAEGLEVEVGDVRAFLTAHRGAYDLVVAIDFIEHFTKDELVDLVPALRGALAPGGHLLLQTPNGQGLFPNQAVHGDLTHMVVLNPDSLAQLLRFGGFDEPRFFEAGPAPVGLKGVARFAAWRAVRAAAQVVRLVETGKRQRIWTENFIALARRGDTP